MYMRAAPPDPAILEFCNTDHQRKCLEAWIETGTAAAAAKKLGLEFPETIVSMKSKVAKRAALGGVFPDYDMSSKVAPGFQLNRGYSMLTKTPDGEPIWLKASPDKLALEKQLEGFVDNLILDINPAKKKPKLKKTDKFDKNLMAGIFIGDSHYGMYAHGQETKHSNFDSQTAYDNMTAAIDDLVERAPQCETGLLVDVGDYTHSNSSLNATFAGTPVDVDTRHGRTMDVAAMGMRHGIEAMLGKFKKVVVVIARGNHNPDVALAIQRILAAFYHNEPRVTILDTHGYFHYLEWGEWLIGINHGDKMKPEKLVTVMARDMAEAWGRTTSRMWALGHFHHQDVKELDGCYVQKFAALPPPDSWHASNGYSSIQAMQMVVFKREGGRHSTLIYELPRPKHEVDYKIA
jgi:hypothetical protein